jgi:hypothetical protein
LSRLFPSFIYLSLNLVSLYCPHAALFSDMNARIQHVAHEIAAEENLDSTEFVGVTMPSQVSKSRPLVH